MGNNTLNTVLAALVKSEAGRVWDNGDDANLSDSPERQTPKHELQIKKPYPKEELEPPDATLDLTEKGAGTIEYDKSLTTPIM